MSFSRDHIGRLGFVALLLVLTSAFTAVPMVDLQAASGATPTLAQADAPTGPGCSIYRMPLCDFCAPCGEFCTQTCSRTDCTCKCVCVQ